MGTHPPSFSLGSTGARCPFRHQILPGLHTTILKEREFLKAKGASRDWVLKAVIAALEPKEAGDPGEGALARPPLVTCGLCSQF